MGNYDWTSFTVRININATINSMYEMWSSSTGIERWFLRQCVLKNDHGELKTAGELITKGDQFLWRWYGYPDDTEQKGEILEANGSDLIQFTFGQRDAESMTCTVKIYAEEGENICEIIQENIPENEKGKTYYHLGCLAGWTFYLASLKSILEGGIDLRNKNERLKKMINS